MLIPHNNIYAAASIFLDTYLYLRVKISIVGDGLEPRHDNVTRDVLPWVMKKIRVGQ